MCTTCGCGDLDKRHKATDIVRDDLQRAADGQDMPIEATIRNLESALQRLRSGSRDPGTSRSMSASGSGQGSVGRDSLR